MGGLKLEVLGGFLGGGEGGILDIIWAVLRVTLWGSSGTACVHEYSPAISLNTDINLALYLHIWKY